MVALPHLKMRTVPVPSWLLVALLAAAGGYLLAQQTATTPDGRPTKAGLYISQNATQWSHLDRHRLYFLCIPDAEPESKEEPIHDHP